MEVPAKNTAMAKSESARRAEKASMANVMADRSIVPRRIGDEEIDKNLGFHGQLCDRDDTIPLEEDDDDDAVETEFMEESSDLAGETQFMEVQDPVSWNRGFEVCVETEAAEDGEEGSQKTAVLDSDEEHSDEVSTPFVIPSVNCIAESDQASPAVGGDGSGPIKRSFSEVRAASLRAAGLAASRNATPEIGVSLRNSSFAGEVSHGDEAASRNVSHAARKLDFEEKLSGGADGRNSEPVYSLYCSQEPAEQIKADALKAVDKFLFVNDMGLSQDYNNGTRIEVEKFSVPIAVGAHKLMKTCIPGNPLGKARIFDWVDSCEDEGGGDFFTKRKDLFFGGTLHMKKSHASSLKEEGRFSGDGSKRTRLSSSERRRKPKTSIGDVSRDSPVKLSRTAGPDTQVAAEAMDLISSNLGGSVRRSMRLKALHNTSKEDGLSVIGPHVSYSLENERVNLEQVKFMASLDDANEEEKTPERGRRHEGEQAVEDTYVLPTSESSNVSPICTSAHSLREKCQRRLSRSSVFKEPIKLGKAEISPNVGLRDLRRRREIASIRVCLSHHLDDDIIKKQKRILVRLGISSVDCVSEATHFVADKFVRTRNMLLGMALGKPVVSHHWLESCSQARCAIDEKNYILRDVKKEKEIGFSMPDSLSRARQKSFLQGKRVFITPNVKPSRELVADLVRAAKGEPLERVGRSAAKEDLLVISCDEDFAISSPFLERGGEVFSSELLLNGIVVQRLDYERHQIFTDRIKRTRSTIWIRTSSNNQFLSLSKSRNSSD
ncbi:uncharacterized protein LOC144715727 [Wolffia australiana]